MSSSAALLRVYLFKARAGVGNAFLAADLLRCQHLRPVWRIMYNAAVGTFVVRCLQWHLPCDLVLKNGMAVQLTAEKQ
jgi:hypothetical protein